MPPIYLDYNASTPVDPADVRQQGAHSKRHVHVFVIDGHHRRWPNDT
ncbi:hypothetical protein V4R08_15985 (plasmid) [Nitrobacter sp. NHB1]